MSPIRVLYSFPHKIGAGRICTTAWQQVAALDDAGARLLVHPGSVAKQLPASVRVEPTLSRGKARIPYRAVGHRRALALHDHIVARRLPGLASEIDLVHLWPSGALDTLRAAKRLGLPTVLERPNAHTRYAYDVVQRESARIGVSLPPDHEHAYNASTLRKEEDEFELADRLLCPSEFVASTFRERGFDEKKLAPHSYGYDDSVFYPDPEPRDDSHPLRMIFIGGNAVRKGLHFALEAWLRSPAHEDGTFLIAGDFIPGYRERFASMIDHPSVQALGFRSDSPELLRQSDILVLPTLEEGSPLVCFDALASGCVPVVSDVCAGVCVHMENALVHKVADVDTLTEHLTLLYEDRQLLARLRAGAIMSAPRFTWRAAGARLLDVYRELVEQGA